MRSVLLVFGLCLACVARAQGSPAPSTRPLYDEALAKRLGANDRGMKGYVLVMLKTGPKSDLPKEERSKLFAGHMRNINRLAADGTLVVAGPMAPNDRHYEGIFIFNVTTIEEAEALLATDPAVAAGALAFEPYVWYGSAALQETAAIHGRIDKTGR